MARRRQRDGIRSPSVLKAGEGSIHLDQGQVGPVASVKRRFFRLVALTSPVVLWIGCECTLRWTGAGFNPHFFRAVASKASSEWVENPEFGRRFFPRPLVRAPQALRVVVPKPADTIRVFILGESAALGDPRPRYGAARYLQVLLEERFPGTRFEVVNTAMTAINSHVIREIARDLESMDGDFWVIYMGNNEMVGPFGAATVFGLQAPPLWLVRASVEMQQLRTLQALKELLDQLPGRRTQPAVWGGMTMFLGNTVLPEDPRRDRVYRNFARNVEAILASARRAGVAVILSTVAVNLRDCPPFHAIEPMWLNAAEQERFTTLLRQAAAATETGRIVEAIAFYRAAAALAPQHAEVHYRLARALLASGDDGAAREHFRAACRWDGLPFRADNCLNDVLHLVAQQHREMVTLCDAEQMLGAMNPAGVPGAESFFEHVHFHFEGNYQLARLWAEAIAARLPESVRQTARPEWLTRTECERQLGLTDWNRRSVVAEMLVRIRQPPFDERWAEVRQRLESELTALDRRIRGDAADAARAQARQVYETALKRRPDDPALHENYAEFLEAVGDLETALVHRRRVCELLPHHYFSYYCLGTLLKEMRRVEEARQALETAARLKPDLAEVQLELGAILAAQQQWEPARQALARARRLDPTHPRTALLLGAVLNQLGQTEQALAAFREAVQLDPASSQAQLRLGECLLKLGRREEAIAALEEAVRLAPDLHRARLQLARAWLQLGQRARAREQLAEILNREPTHPDARRLEAQLTGP
ncbi:MAG: tetratricopeptide repeat protein [Verrucomicrobiota bacterium]|nr:tetratricopeptide repeat protein [Limisphaera sp.]MDW8381053.1 tetratricopeptide repeat protein [Verrucomicrobiota bacterium]